RVRLQNQGSGDGRSRYRGTVDCLRVMIKEEKIRGLYKGMGSPIVGVAVINSLLFGVYGWFLHHLSQVPFINGANADPDTPSVSTIFWAGCFSGSINALVSCPMELVKIRLQNQQNLYTGPIDCCRKIFRAEGLRGFYRGFHATLWRETPSYGAYFASYEVLSHMMTSKDQRLDVPSPGLLMAGGIAGVIAWLSTYPLDVVKTRLQSGELLSDVSGKRQGLISCFRTICRQEGVKTLFSGLGATAIRAFPTNAATFYTVTYVKQLLE
ncbi:mitochondrial carrier domain-containing protein, partial [Zopfochytrium polystomum]